MKKLNQILFTATVAVAFTFTCQAVRARSADNGITASPKVQEMLDSEKKVSESEAPQRVAPAARVPGDDKTVASPKVRQMEANAPVSGLAHEGATVTPYPEQRSTGWIAASPKVRQQLDQQPVQFEIAPLK
jgi:hypothetical protein